MQFLEGDHIVGYWVASNNNNDNTTWCLIKRNDNWILEVRFRYNRSNENDDPFSGKDIKNVYEVIEDVKDKSLDEMLSSIDLLFNISKFNGYDKTDNFRVDGDAKKFIEIAKTKDYFHIKEEKIN